MKAEPAARLDGHLAVPGDKSISHRALLVGAICEGETRVSHWGRSGDTTSTLGAVRAVGVRVDEVDDERLVVDLVDPHAKRADSPERRGRVARAAPV